MVNRVYTRRFAAASGDQTAPKVVFTASDAWVWIVRDVLLTNQLAEPQLLHLYIATGLANFTLFLVPVAEGVSSYHLELRQEILPSEELVVASTLGAWNCLVTGYTLTPPLEAGLSQLSWPGVTQSTGA